LFIVLLTKLRLHGILEFDSFFAQSISFNPIKNNNLTRYAKHGILEFDTFFAQRIPLN